MSASEPVVYLPDAQHPIFEAELGKFVARYDRDRRRVVVMRTSSGSTNSIGFAVEECADLSALLNSVTGWADL